VFVLPSKGPGETWGLSVNEALACDRPVLVSNKCGCAVDLVVPGENGLIFEAGNRGSLKTSMHTIHNMQFSVSSIRSVVHRFCIQSIAESLEEAV
jgi:glycosyltransferase involved in cell wall biosynthesis